MIKIKCNTCGFTEEVLVIFEGATCSKCGSNLIRVIHYTYQSDRTKLLKMLRASLTMKKKKGWSRDVGAGFIAEDIKSVILNPDKTVTIKSHYGLHHNPRYSMWSLNLRETEELLRYVEQKGEQ